MTGLGTRFLREWAFLAALLVALLVAAQRGGWLDRADFWFYDTSVRWSTRAAAPDILLLAIDEISLARNGRWPWSRQVLADVVERLAAAGSGPVLLDVILSEAQAGEPAADARLADAIGVHGRVVLPVFMPQAGTPAILPIPRIAAHARLGHAQALVDSDGVTRRYLPLENAAGTSYRHVAAVLLEAGAIWPTPQGLRPDVAALVPFAGPAGHFARQPVAALLDGRIPATELRGKFVLVGATATGLGDNVVTPLAGANGAMAGVEFVANLVDGLRLARTPQPLGPGIHLALSAGLLLALLLALLASTPRTALLITVLACVGALLGAWAALAWWGWWWPPAASIAVMALAYPLWSWRRLEASLSAMARETTRIAGLLQPDGGAARTRLPLVGFLDPVETRIAAITSAVDQIAGAIAAGVGSAHSGQLRDDMMRHLAHDLRAPLVSLRALAGQLRTGDATEHAAMLDRVDACARRSLDLTEQFLLLGRAQALDPARFAQVDLVQVLHQSADDLWEDAQRSGARIVRRCVLDTAPIHGDPKLLQRVLLNLGWNALRHGPAGGSVTLSLEPLPDGYVLAVHDQGSGFSPDALALLSQRYTQAAGTQAGHGLGLALVWLVAEKHQATLVAAQPAEGGFSLSLRIAYVRKPALSIESHGTEPCST